MFHLTSDHGGDVDDDDGDRDDDGMSTCQALHLLTHRHHELETCKCL